MRAFAVVTLVFAAVAVHAGEGPSFCHELDCPKYSVVEAGDNWELRSYEKASWVSTQVEGLILETALTTGFKRLYDYISGENEESVKINMTAPVRTKIIPGDGPFCKSNFTISFFVPFAFQDGSAPKPSNPDVYLDAAHATEVYVTAFGGFAISPVVMSKAKNLTETLQSAGAPIETESFFLAGYDSPFRLTNRHNEVWIVKKPSTITLAQ